MSARLPSDLLDELIELRRDLHRHPELSWEEERTAKRVEAFLDRHAIRSRRVAGTGVIVELPAVGHADDHVATQPHEPVIALRADLDALPIHEETGLPFSSERDGCMHACGHDAHTSMLLGATALLARETERATPIRLLFQPAEEVGEGAMAMIEHGALDDVALIFGGHVDRHFETGTIVVSDGPVNASTDTFRIRVHGRSAHAARPHEGVDAIVVATLIVTAIQTIVSREINPAHPGVVTIGRIDAGTAPNVLAGSAILEGTIRAQEPAVREQLLVAVERMVVAAGQFHGAQVDFAVFASTPPVINPPLPTSLARAAATDIVGDPHVRPLEIANMGAEDFGRYVERVDGCYVRFGSQLPGCEGFPAHSSRFDVDERVLGIGAAYFHAVAMRAGQYLHDQSGASS